ncbi:MAG: hypothetical protein JRI68_01505 [Deltaproteobacteria bacterium]|nr:hypothetical protein [Deltaproteobacteria bacterium]
MARSRSAAEIAVVIAVGGSVLAVAVPSFVRNLNFSKLSEPIDGLSSLVNNTIAYSRGRPQNISFPPSAPLTPEEVPRGVSVEDQGEAWEHLTWRSLSFRIDGPHCFAFKFDSALDPQSGVMRFVAAAHGDLDGDGVLSTFEVRGERVPGQDARVLPGMFVDREVE